MAALTYVLLCCGPLLLQSSPSILRYRGGSAVTPPPSIRSEVRQSPLHVQPEYRHVVVTAALGSRYLDRRKLLRIDSNATVAGLKDVLSRQFPGCPPPALQTLYLGSRVLLDDMVMNNITDLSPIPVSMDLLTGTGIYNRTILSVSDALEMLAALEAHAIANAKMQVYLIDGGIRRNASGQNLHLVKELFRSRNASIYDTMGGDIAAALTAEKNPEKETADTSAWRTPTANRMRMMGYKEVIGGTLNMNWEEVKSSLIASVLLSAYAQWGSSSVTSKYLLMLGIWGFWLSRLRLLRYYSKVLAYFILPQLMTMDFALPLVSTPYQALARYFYTLLNGVAPSDTDTNAQEKVTNVSYKVGIDLNSLLGGTSGPEWATEFRRWADVAASLPVRKYATSISKPVFRSAYSILNSLGDASWAAENIKIDSLRVTAAAATRRPKRFSSTGKRATMARKSARSILKEAAKEDKR